MKQNIKYNLTWFSSQLPSKYNELHVHQTSCWILTSDKKFILVSKNGEDWTIPGGHPENFDMNLTDSLIREVMEETGFDISKYKENLKLVGNYVIEDIDVETNKIIDAYIQRRYLLEITENSTELNLKIKEGDSVKYVNTFTPSESLEKVKWMKNANDFIEINKMLNLIN